MLRLRRVHHLVASSMIATSSRSVSSDRLGEWGSHFMSVNERRVADSETLYRTTVAARDQLQMITTRWNADAHLHLCGSVVTTGQMERGSDLDVCCLAGDILPERSVQAKMTTKLYSAIKRSIPNHLRSGFLDLTSPRTPVVKMSLSNEAEIAPTRCVWHDDDDVPQLRTVKMTHMTKVISEEELRDFVERLRENEGITVESSSVTPTEDESGSVIELVLDSKLHALMALAAVPDGKLVTNAQAKEDFIKDFPDRTLVPEMLRYNFDVSFAGYSVTNSYLIRHYLLSDPMVRHGAMMLKSWGKANNVGWGGAGYLTSYAMTILWLYFLLVTRQVRWVDPASVPHACDLPLAPAYVPLAQADPVQLGHMMLEFYRFYSEEFDYEREVASLNRPRRSTRKDLEWTFTVKDPFHYLFCIEDPYEQVGAGGLNLGRHLDEKKFKTVRSEFAKAVKMMLAHDPTSAPDSAMSGVRRPELRDRDQERARKAEEKRMEKAAAGEQP